jgi:hypothetical protein
MSAQPRVAGQVSALARDLRRIVTTVDECTANAASTRK